MFLLIRRGAQRANARMTVQFGNMPLILSILERKRNCSQTFFGGRS
jgi:hypothetical protein